MVFFHSYIIFSFLFMFPFLYFYLFFSLLSIISEGGFFKARLTFPKDYPQMPPTMRFTSPMFHPNGAPPPDTL